MKRVDDTLDSLQSGANGPKGKSKALTPRSKRMAEMYEEIKYQDDEQMLPWQRQLKVNRFMSDLQVRKYIEELNEPILMTQQKIKQQMDNKFVKVMEQNEKRLVLLEQAVFNKDGPELRFEKIEREQSEQHL